ncbi:hypothetical protein SNEBB_004160 [Seison nebaliae]|nr:hypothetical protein SNEBB_004160 [Seison nebaliae]
MRLFFLLLSILNLYQTTKIDIYSLKVFQKSECLLTGTKSIHVHLLCENEGRLKILQTLFGIQQKYSTINLTSIESDERRSCKHSSKNCYYDQYFNIDNICTGRSECKTSINMKELIISSVCDGKLFDYIHIKYQCFPKMETIDICSEISNKHIQTAYITSPHYPIDFPINLRCRCQLDFLNTSGKNRHGIILLKRIDMKLSSHRNEKNECDETYLKIKENRYSTQGVKKCGYKRDVSSLFGSGHRRVDLEFFTSNNSHKIWYDNGFWIYFEVSPSSTNDIVRISCGRNLDISNKHSTNQWSSNVPTNLQHHSTEKNDIQYYDVSDSEIINEDYEERIPFDENEQETISTFDEEKEKIDINSKKSPKVVKKFYQRIPMEHNSNIEKLREFLNEAKDVIVDQKHSLNFFKFLIDMKNTIWKVTTTPKISTTTTTTTTSTTTMMTTKIDSKLRSKISTRRSSQLDHYRNIEKVNAIIRLRISTNSPKILNETEKILKRMKSRKKRPEKTTKRSILNNSFMLSNMIKLLFSDKDEKSVAEVERDWRKAMKSVRDAKRQMPPRTSKPKVLMKKEMKKFRINQTPISKGKKSLLKQLLDEIVTYDNDDDGNLKGKNENEGTVELNEKNESNVSRTSRHVMEKRDKLQLSVNERNPMNGLNKTFGQLNKKYFFQLKENSNSTTIEIINRNKSKLPRFLTTHKLSVKETNDDNYHYDENVEFVEYSEDDLTTKNDKELASFRLPGNHRKFYHHLSNPLTSTITSWKKENFRNFYSTPSTARMTETLWNYDYSTDLDYSSNLNDYYSEIYNDPQLKKIFSSIKNSSLYSTIKSSPTITTIPMTTITTRIYNLRRKFNGFNSQENNYKKNLLKIQPILNNRKGNFWKENFYSNNKPKFSHSTRSTLFNDNYHIYQYLNRFTSGKPFFRQSSPNSIKRMRYTMLTTSHISTVTTTKPTTTTTRTIKTISITLNSFKTTPTTRMVRHFEKKQKKVDEKIDDNTEIYSMKSFYLILITLAIFLVFSCLLMNLIYCKVIRNRKNELKSKINDSFQLAGYVEKKTEKNDGDNSTIWTSTIPFVPNVVNQCTIQSNKNGLSENSIDGSLFFDVTPKTTVYSSINKRLTIREALNRLNMKRRCSSLKKNKRQSSSTSTFSSSTYCNTMNSNNNNNKEFINSPSSTKNRQRSLSCHDAIDKQYLYLLNQVIRMNYKLWKKQQKHDNYVNVKYLNHKKYCNQFSDLSITPISTSISSEILDNFLIGLSKTQNTIERSSSNVDLMENENKRKFFHTPNKQSDDLKNSDYSNSNYIKKCPTTKLLRVFPNSSDEMSSKIKNNSDCAIENSIKLAQSNQFNSVSNTHQIIQKFNSLSTNTPSVTTTNTSQLLGKQLKQKQVHKKKNLIINNNNNNRYQATESTSNCSNSNLSMNKNFWSPMNDKKDRQPKEEPQQKTSMIMINGKATYLPIINDIDDVNLINSNNNNSNESNWNEKNCDNYLNLSNTKLCSDDLISFGAPSTIDSLSSDNHIIYSSFDRSFKHHLHASYHLHSTNHEHIYDRLNKCHSNDNSETSNLKPIYYGLGTSIFLSVFIANLVICCYCHRQRSRRRKKISSYSNRCSVDMSTIQSKTSPQYELNNNNHLTINSKIFEKKLTIDQIINEKDIFQLTLWQLIKLRFAQWLQSHTTYQVVHEWIEKYIYQLKKRLLKDVMSSENISMETFNQAKSNYRSSQHSRSNQNRETVKTQMKTKRIIIDESDTFHGRGKIFFDKTKQINDTTYGQYQSSPSSISSSSSSSSINSTNRRSSSLPDKKIEIIMENDDDIDHQIYHQNDNNHHSHHQNDNNHQNENVDDLLFEDIYNISALDQTQKPRELSREKEDSNISDTYDMLHYQIQHPNNTNYSVGNYENLNNFSVFTNNSSYIP